MNTENLTGIANSIEEKALDFDGINANNLEGRKTLQSDHSNPETSIFTEDLPNAEDLSEIASSILQNEQLRKVEINYFKCYV